MLPVLPQYLPLAKCLEDIIMKTDFLKSLNELKVLIDSNQLDLSGEFQGYLSHFK